MFFLYMKKKKKKRGNFEPVTSVYCASSTAVWWLMAVQVGTPHAQRSSCHTRETVGQNRNVNPGASLGIVAA